LGIETMGLSIMFLAKSATVDAKRAKIGCSQKCRHPCFWQKTELGLVLAAAKNEKLINSSFPGLAPGATKISPLRGWIGSRTLITFLNSRLY
jgi:hypothetical protein